MLADRMRIAATPKGAAPGQQAYTTAGTYTFTVPAGVTSVCVLCVGGGQGGGAYSGAGGSLAYSNNISVTPGASITLTVGSGGYPNDVTGGSGGTTGGASTFGSGPTVRAVGGNDSRVNIGSVSYSGGAGYAYASGAGGAGGYSGAGGTQSSTSINGSGGAGGAGGTGAQYNDGTNAYTSGGAGGGGVGLLGSGTSGLAGANSSSYGADSGGSSGVDGPYDAYSAGGNGGSYGGGGGAGSYVFNIPTSFFSSTTYGGYGAVGAVRIIWGSGRSYPSNAANV